jgi:hypothetical protein
MAITDEVLKTLGRIAVSAAKLENMTLVLVRELIDDDPRVGRVAMGGDPGFARVVQQLVPLAELRGLDESLVRRFQQAAVSARRAMEERNRVMHSHWMSGEDDTLIQARREGKAGDYYLEVTEEDLTVAWLSLHDAEREIRRLWVKVAHEFGRAESTDDGRVLSLPNRWPEAETRPSPSRSWTARDRWARGLIEWWQVEAEEAEGEPAGVTAPNCPTDVTPMRAGDGGWVCNTCGLVRLT